MPDISSALSSLAQGILSVLRELVAAAGWLDKPEKPDPKDVVLGDTIEEEDEDGRCPASLSPQARRKHLYVLGATGTGKTSLLLRLIQSDIEHKRTFCVVDLRGDLVDRVLLRIADAGATSSTTEGAAAGAASTWGKRLLLIDLRQSDHVVAFNPRSGAGEPSQRALHMLSVIRRNAEGWGVQLEETLRNALVALAESGHSLLELEPLLENAAFRAEVMEKVTDLHVRRFFERFNALPTASRTAWTLPVLNKVTPLLATPQMRLMLAGPQAFSFNDLLDRQPGSVILVALAVDRLHESAHAIGGLFVSALQNAVMARVDLPEEKRRPVYLYVDEFETMATERFEALISDGRRFGLGLCLSHQNGAQLPPRLRQTVRSNAHTQVYFQTGAQEAAGLTDEISGPWSKKEVRAHLVRHRVGECFLVRRGKDSVRLKTRYTADPRVRKGAVQTLRQASLDRYAWTRADVEAEIRRRDEELRAAGSATGARNAGAKGTIYEVRHEKTARFAPADPLPDDLPDDLSDARPDTPPQAPPGLPPDTGPDDKPGDGKPEDGKPGEDMG
jgi:hypothetical protein